MEIRHQWMMSTLGKVFSVQGRCGAKVLIGEANFMPVLLNKITWKWIPLYHPLRRQLPVNTF